uniref:WAP domain-containing protein n=1 Tax=Sinocyclocheilus rhinocerous TaxID=307959 RepID=A0A673GGQ2_9TELE
MTARVYCSLIAFLSGLSGYLSITDATVSFPTMVAGFCPMTLTVVPSRRGCFTDGDCSGGDKCCIFESGPVCVPPVSMTFPTMVAGFCPMKLTVVPSRQGCFTDGDCSGGDKCCIFESGPVCVPPVSMDRIIQQSVMKPGLCPPPTSGRSCTTSCNSDSDCPNNEKCCSNGCEHYCTAPYTVKPGLCPKPKNIHACAESCFHDGQCPDTQKCCPTTCGHACSEPHGQGNVFRQVIVEAEAVLEVEA